MLTDFAGRKFAVHPHQLVRQLIELGEPFVAALEEYEAKNK